MMITPMSLLTLAQVDGPLNRAIFREPGASVSARDSDDIFMWITWYSVIWFVVLMAAMFYWVVKYRRKPGEPLIRSTSHNTPLELIWTIVPSIFLGYMFYKGFEGYLGKLAAPTNAQVIDIEGFKWDWTASYPNGGVENETTDSIGGDPAKVIYVPVGRPTQFRMTSRDVLHSFWIPDFRVKMDVIPNRYSSYFIMPEEVGDHWIFCAEYCGDLHSEMAAVLRVVTEEEYQKHIEGLKIDTSNPVEWGRGLVQGKGGCLACHSLTGERIVGPSWLNVWGHEVPLAGGGSIPADDANAWDNYIIESILNPNAKMREGYVGGMSSYAGVFTDEELRAIVAFIRSLSDKAPESSAPAGAAPAEAE